MRFNRRFAILAVPAILALAGGAVAVHAAVTPTPAASQSESGTESQAEDSAATVPGKAAPAEPADPAGDVQSGHSDSGDQVDHQATGNE
jgi:hypothetical protein